MPNEQTPTDWTEFNDGGPIVTVMVLGQRILALRTDMLKWPQPPDLENLYLAERVAGSIQISGLCWYVGELILKADRDGAFDDPFCVELRTNLRRADIADVADFKKASRETLAYLLRRGQDCYGVKKSEGDCMTRLAQAFTNIGAEIGERLMAEAEESKRRALFPSALAEIGNWVVEQQRKADAKAQAPATAVQEKAGEPAEAVRDVTPELTRHRGRLPAEESEAKRATFLATIRQHGSLKEDPVKLAMMVDISESTARRWLKDEEEKYAESRAANPDPDENRPKE